MPQVNTQNLGKALDMVSDKVKVTKGKIEAGKLKKSQKELHQDKIEGIAKRFTSPDKFKPLIISQDNHIVDGHHRWGAAIYKWGEDVKIPIFRIHLPILKAIKLYKDIANSINEAITIPIEIGDTVLGGKFKNKRIVVKSIGKNEKGDITINGKPLLKFRLVNENTDKIEMMKLLSKAMKAFPGSPQQLKIKKELNKLRIKNGLKPIPEGTINEIPMADLQKIDQFADKKLSPFDVVLTDKHFFDRLNDPRNKKEITSAELIGFFKRLSKKKKQFLDFLDKYNQIVTTDGRTNINIPFMQKANKVIAKTVMRKKDFKTPNKKLEI
jgi:hypothetical protein